VERVVTLKVQNMAQKNEERLKERFFCDIERSLDENSCVTSRALAAMTNSNVQMAQRFLFCFHFINFFDLVL
jgi:hypothetical protein